MGRSLKGCSLLVFLVVLGIGAFYAYFKFGSDQGDGSSLVTRLENEVTRSWKQFAQEEREWTDVTGRTLKGFFIDASDSEVLIRVVPGQRVYRIPLSKLSVADRDWVSAKASTKAEFQTTYPSISSRWPNRVEGRTRPLNLNFEQGSNRWTTTNYEFRCDGNVEAEIMKGLATTCEAVDVALSQSPLPLLWGRETGARRVIMLYTSEETFRASGGPEHAAAYYIPLTDKVHIPLTALKFDPALSIDSRFTLNKRNNYRILVHELVHQASAAFLFLDLPAWIAEGTAELFSAAQNNPGEFSFSNQKAQIRRYLSEQIDPDQSVQFKTLPLPRLAPYLNQNLREFNEASSRSMSDGFCQYAAALLLVEFFAVQDGNSLRPYLEAVYTGLSPGEAMENHLLRGRSPVELEQEIMTQWGRMGISLVFTEKPEIDVSNFRRDIGIESSFRR